MTRVALVYDRVNKFGGAERVLQSLHQLYPQAPLYTAVYNSRRASWAKGWDVRPSILNRLPGASTHHESLVMAMPRVFESFDFSGYDLVISVTSAEAKGIITRAPTKHICYLLTPTRYLWSHTHHYAGSGFGRYLRLPFQSHLRGWDFQAAQRPDLIIPISETVKRRCLKYYRRQPGPVIYPPVAVKRLQSSPIKPLISGNYFLVVSRLVSYKNVDQVIVAFNRLPQEKLVIVGSGNQESYLRRLAQKNTVFLGQVHESDLINLYQHTQALIFPQEEDFGIVSIEAQAAGKPVIALGKGGAAETVIQGQTGILYPKASTDMIIEAISQAKNHHWSKLVIQAHANLYDEAIFKAKFSQLVEAYV